MSTNDVVFLSGEKTILRPVVKDDLPFFQVWINDPETRIFVCNYLPLTLSDEEAWFASLSQNKSNIVFAMVDKASGKLIGNLGLSNISWVNGTAVTGAMIGDKEFRGQGYGTDAKGLLLTYAFSTLNLRKLCSSVIAFNGRSLAYNFKCGYHQEGVRRLQVYRNGEYHDEILMAIFKEDWLRQQSS